VHRVTYKELTDLTTCDEAILKILKFLEVDASAAPKALDVTIKQASFSNFLKKLHSDKKSCFPRYKSML